MSKIKCNQQNLLNKQVEERVQQALAEKNISVSFEHELSNKSHSPDGIKDKNDKLYFYEEFRKRLRDVTAKTWKEFGMYRKKMGYETIPFKQFSENLQISLKNTNIVSPDSKLDVIRVTNQYRIIGKYLNGVFYIIGYDIDFSAYKH